jgi:hypothetical protein
LPLLHLCKRMPEVAVVPVFQLSSSWCTSHGGKASGL